MKQVAERLTTNKGQCEACIGCIEESNCKVECGAIDDCLERLAEYETAEKQGKLVMLPCRLGDTIYFILERHDFVTRVIPCEVHRITLTQNGIYLDLISMDPMIGHADWHHIEHIGESIFLTRGEAEAALERRDEE